MSPLVLASRSPARIQLMRQAGLAFEAEASEVDERAIEQRFLDTGVSPAELALLLAEAKAVDVAARRSGDWVIGADQTLELDGQRFVKAESIDAARSQLIRLRGRTHSLHAAVACVRGETVLWRHVSTARLTMRAFSAEFIERYLAEQGEHLLGSVGAYQLEGAGIQLFEAIDGDYFTILGLPLLPLIGFLRGEGLIAT